MAISSAAIVAAGFAFLQIGLAWIVVSVRPRRVANVLVTALFVLNGVIVAMAAARLQGIWPGSRPLEAFLDAQTFALLVVLALAYPTPRLGPRALVATGVAVSLVLSVLAVAAALDPYPGVSVLQPSASPRALAYDAVALLAFVGATLVLLDSYLGARSEIRRAQSAYFLAAYAMKLGVIVAVVVGYGAGFSLLMGDAPLLAALAFAAVVVALAAAPVALLASRIRGRAAGRTWSEDLFIVAFAAGGVVLVALTFDSTLESLLVRPLLIAYGMLRFQLLDVEAHEHRRMLGALAIVAAAEIFVSVQVTTFAGILDPNVRTGVALAVSLAALALVAPPVVRRLGGGGEAEARARAVYLAALEESVGRADARGTSTDRVLRALRGRLHISDREHAAMEASVRAALAGADRGPLVGYAYLGRYRVEAVLGEGGFGRTFLARDEQIDRRVVLKVARVAADEEGERLLAEARLLARVRHANVVTVYDVERVGDECVLVLEHVEGGSLADRLRAGPLAPADAAAVADDLLAGLDAMHARGVVHRDVKPANVLLRPDGRAVLTDFGIARGPGGTGTAASYGLGGANAGSLRYMAPEQVRGARVGPACDLYAAAVVLHEMVTGRSYLGLEHMADYDAARAIVEEDPPRPISGLPDSWEPLLRAALAKDPAARPASAGEMRVRLAAAAATVPRP